MTEGKSSNSEVVWWSIALWEAQRFSFPKSIQSALERDHELVDNYPPDDK